jgi:hypothetical protein
VQEKDDDSVIYLLNLVKGQNTITVWAQGHGQQVVLGQKVLKVSYVGGELLVEEAAGFPDETITGLQSVEETGGQRTAYSLQGHRLPSVPQKGLYVVKGKKQITR